MKQKFTNEHGISLPMAVFLADDRYEYDPRPNVISVTTLMKSVRQIVLGSRLKEGESLTDISSLLASRLGTAIHESIEKAWVSNYQSSLEALGYPQGLIKRININPEGIPEGINLWLELRTEVQVGKWIISGCADIILEEAVRDVKSTKVWTYTSGANTEKYRLQLSLYRWLNQDKVTDDTGYIEFLFTDWAPLKASYEEGYPSLPVLAQAIPLSPIAATQAYVTSKLEDIETYFDSPEQELPWCSDEELWIRDSEWKYFSKPDAKRATKNFKADKAGAFMHLAEKGKGEVREVKGKAMACSYCNVRANCSQFQSLQLEGRI